MRRNVLVFVSAFCCVLSATAALAQPKWQDTHLGRCKLDTVWSGPTLDEDSLFGKVVVVVFWEADNDSSLKALSNLVALEKRYKRYGLVAIAAYNAKDIIGDKEKPKAVSSAKSRRVTFTVVSAGRIFVHGKAIEKVPHGAIYDHVGQTAYNDYPGQAMEKKIVELLKARPAHLALMFVKDYNEKNYKDRYKFMLSAIAKIKQNRLGDAWKDCEARKDDVNQRGDQARAVLDGLGKYADRLIERAKKHKSDSPTKAAELLTEVSRAYKKGPKGEEASKMLKEWTSDAKFQAERRAEAPFRAIVRMAERIPPRPLGGPERHAWERRWKRSFGSLERALKKFEKDYPGTEFLEKAKRLVTGIAEGTGGKSILD